MLAILLPATILFLAAPSDACESAAPVLAAATAIAPAAQPPQPAEPTPEPGEPIDPPVLEEPPPAPRDPGIPTPDPSDPCCFTNPRYTGVCVVRPASDETCGTILGYLNDDRSTGKTYCNRTDIRGGWEWVRCEE